LSAQYALATVSRKSYELCTTKIGQSSKKPVSRFTYALTPTFYPTQHVVVVPSTNITPLATTTTTTTTTITTITTTTTITDSASTWYVGA